MTIILPSPILSNLLTSSVILSYGYTDFVFYFGMENLLCLLFDSVQLRCAIFGYYATQYIPFRYYVTDICWALCNPPHSFGHYAACFICTFFSGSNQPLGTVQSYYISFGHYAARLHFTWVLCNLLCLYSDTMLARAATLSALFWVLCVLKHCFFFWYYMTNYTSVPL